MAFLTVSLAVVLGEGTAGKRVHAEGAHKVLRVPLLVKGVDTLACNGLAATRAGRASLLVVVHLAVRLASKLVEGTSCKALLAVLAYKVLGVPLLAQRVDALPLDGLVATGALRCIDAVEATLAIWPAVPLKETAVLKRFQALCANEMVDVPLLAQRGDAAIQYWLVTMSTPCTEQFLVASFAMRKAVLFIKIVGA